MDLHQQIFFTTLAIAFGMLHLILFLYNRRLTSNLYFAIFVLFYAANVFYDFQASLATSGHDGLFYLRIHRGVLPYSPMFALLFVYSLSESKVPRQFWFIAGGLIVTGIFAIVEPIENFDYLQILFIAVWIEAVRLTVAGIKRSREGAWIIAVGFAFLWVFSFYDMLMDVGVIDAIQDIQNGYPFGFLGLIISMSAFLARDFSIKSKKLQEYSETFEEKVDERTREPREAQNQLILKEKMASLGNLVARSRPRGQ